MALNLLKARLRKRFSKEETTEWAREILAGRISKSDLRALLSAEETEILFNLYWVLATVAGISSTALAGLEEDLYWGMQRHPAHEGVVRSVLSVFKNMAIPDALEPELFAYCFKITESAGSAIAHRSFAMLICARICLRYPELVPEFLVVVSIVDETYGEASPGVRSAARQVFRMFTPR